MAGAVRSLVPGGVRQPRWCGAAAQIIDAAPDHLPADLADACLPPKAASIRSALAAGRPIPQIRTLPVGRVEHEWRSHAQRCSWMRHSRQSRGGGPVAGWAVPGWEPVAGWEVPHPAG